MYVYFDTQGVIREIISVDPARVGSSANKIYIYFENNPDIDHLWWVMKKPDDTITTEADIVLNRELKPLPYDIVKNRDLKYFKDYETYNFYVLTLSSSDLNVNGLAELTLRADIDDVLYAQGLLTFNIESSVVKYDNNITQSQYDYLLTQFGNINDIGIVKKAIGNNIVSLTDDEMQELNKDFAIIIDETTPKTIYVKQKVDSYYIYFSRMHKQNYSGYAGQYADIIEGTMTVSLANKTVVRNTNTTTVYDKEEVDYLLGEKQDTLVNQSNIKSINNNSLLGSGNLHLEDIGYFEISVNDTELTDEQFAQVQKNFCVVCIWLDEDNYEYYYKYSYNNSGDAYIFRPITKLIYNPWAYSLKTEYVYFGIDKSITFNDNTVEFYTKSQTDSLISSLSNLKSVALGTLTNLTQNGLTNLIWGKNASECIDLGTLRRVSNYVLPNASTSYNQLGYFYVTSHIGTGISVNALLFNGAQSYSISINSSNVVTFSDAVDEIGYKTLERASNITSGSIINSDAYGNTNDYMNQFKKLVCFLSVTVRGTTQKYIYQKAEFVERVTTVAPNYYEVWKYKRIGNLTENASDYSLDFDYYTIKFYSNSNEWDWEYHASPITIYSKSQVDALISGLSNLSLKREIVASLPVSDISTNTIYMVLDNAGQGANVYNEYLYINENWELIGTSKQDYKLYDLGSTLTNRGTIIQQIVQSNTQCVLKYTYNYNERYYYERQRHPATPLECTFECVEISNSLVRVYRLWCQTNGTDFTHNVYEYPYLQGLVEDWSYNTSYVVDDLVCRSGKIYKCNTNHTSTYTPTENTYWDETDLETLLTDIIDFRALDGSRVFYDGITKITDNVNKVWSLKYNDRYYYRARAYDSGLKANYFTNYEINYDSDDIKEITVRTLSANNQSNTFSYSEKVIYNYLHGLIAHFDTTATYNVNDIVNYNGKVWVCHTAITTAGSWTGATNWTETNLTNLLKGKANTSSLASIYDETQTYNAGDLITKDGVLYECNTDNTTGTWNSSYWDETNVAEAVLGLLNTGV